MVKKKNPDYLQLRKKYENCEGYQLSKVTRELYYYIYILVGNHRDLIKIVEYYEQNAPDLLTIRDLRANKKDLDQYQEEFIRHMFNFLSALKAWKDKMMSWRNHLIKKYGDRIKKEEYLNLLNECKVVKYSKFFDTLRNELTHGTNSGDDQKGFQHFSFSLFQKNSNSPLIANIMFVQKAESVKEVVSFHFNSIYKFHKLWIEHLHNIFEKEITEALELNEKILDLQDERRKII